MKRPLKAKVTSPLLAVSIFALLQAVLRQSSATPLSTPSLTATAITLVILSHNV